jgi:hypothetical protein
MAPKGKGKTGRSKGKKGTTAAAADDSSALGAEDSDKIVPVAALPGSQLTASAFSPELTSRLRVRFLNWFDVTCNFLIFTLLL